MNERVEKIQAMFPCLFFDLTGCHTLLKTTNCENKGLWEAGLKLRIDEKRLM